MTAVVLAHGGTGGAIVEGAFLLLPVTAFFFLSRWSKRREQADAELGADRAPGDGDGDGAAP